MSVTGSKNGQNVSCYFNQHQFKNVYVGKTTVSVHFFILESVFLMLWVIKVVMYTLFWGFIF